MKKFLVLSLLLMFGFCTYAEARVQYDNTGRNVVQDDSIRGRRRAAEIQKDKQRKMEAAAAAKLNYEQALRSLEPQRPRSNFYQDRNKF